MEELKPFFDRDSITYVRRDGLQFTIKTVAVAVIAVVLGVAVFFNLLASRKEIKQSERHDYYKRGGEWLYQHVPAGHIIFNTDWDDFPRLFYYDSNHYYVSGLDPSYLYDKNPELSELYERITLGKEDGPRPADPRSLWGYLCLL
jgi:hypothetical protein